MFGMLTVKHLAALVLGILLFVTSAAAQIVGSSYTCCNAPQSPLLVFGDASVSASPNPFLTSLVPIHNSSAAWLMLSHAEESRPWPLDPSAGWLLVNDAPAYWVGMVPMVVSSSTVHWLYRWDLPPDPALAGTLLFFQAAKIDAAGAWDLSNGWTVTLVS